MIQKQFVEEIICEYLNQRFCFLVGRGTTAIYLALKVIESKVGQGEVILPTISCTSPAQVVYYSGFKPVFADVNLTNFTLDIESLKSRITKETKAILPIHIFGHCSQMNEILEIAEECGIYVIEDAAQALGGNYKGKKIGSLGDFSILSFMGTKIINAGEGGAIVTDNEEFASIIGNEVSRLPCKIHFYDYALKSLSHRNLYHALADLLRVDNNFMLSSAFMAIIPFYSDIYIHEFSGDESTLRKIADGFKNLDADINQQIERAMLYKNLLQDDNLVHPVGWESEGVVWRYSFLIKDTKKLIHITNELRKNGINASNHYWSVADLFYNEKTYSNTSYICPRILNLWVDDNADRAYIEKSCEIILKNLD